MNMKTTAILAGTLLTALLTAQTATASQATDTNYFLGNVSNSKSLMMNKAMIKVSHSANIQAEAVELEDSFFPEGQGQ